MKPKHIPRKLAKTLAPGLLAFFAALLFFTLASALSSCGLPTHWNENNTIDNSTGSHNVVTGGGSSNSSPLTLAFVQSTGTDSTTDASGVATTTVNTQVGLVWVYEGLSGSSGLSIPCEVWVQAPDATAFSKIADVTMEGKNSASYIFTPGMSGYHTIKVIANGLESNTVTVYAVF